MSEITKGDDAAFFHRAWEMMLARHLLACGFSVTSPPGEGYPDFRCEKDGRVIWVEATCVTAGNEPLLAPYVPGVGVPGATYVPHDAILLRWTAARDHKTDKGDGYHRRGIIAPSDAYVIAINGGLIDLGDFGIGASGRPYVVEMTMGVGPLQYRYDCRTLALIEVQHDQRDHLLNHNNAPIAVKAFRDAINVNVSSALGYAGFHSHTHRLPLFVMHNPIARPVIRLPLGLFGPHSREWLAEPVGDEFNAAFWDLLEAAPI